MMRDAQRWEALAGNQRKRARPGERIIEGLIALVSRSAIVFVFLVFLFVLREGWPILTGQTNSALLQKALPLEEMDRMTPDQLRAYLGLSRNEFAAMERETMRELMKVKLEAAAEAPPDKDEKVNTANWRYLLRPYQWTGYDRPVYIWQPISQIQKYNLVPLFVGTLKTTAVALLFAVPLALAAAVYVSQLAPRRWKEFLKPGIELLAGVPSVVLGFFALLVMASLFQSIFGYRSRLNSFVAGIALGLAVIPVIFSIAEDALSSVPRSYTQAALALGANPWQAAWNIVVPAAAQGIFAAIILGFGRAIGETMIVLMASGNASIMSADIFDSTRTMTATIAAELAEAVQGGAHYQILFLIGTLLFIVTFASNLAGDIVVQRLKRRLAGS